jgi:hypothetical protein
MVYIAPSLTLPIDAASQTASSEWVVVAGLLVVLAFFAAIGAWCWFVCNGHVRSCSADYWHLTVTATCYR